MDLATDGQSLYVARASGRKVIVSVGTRTVATVEHPEPLLGEKIAVSPDGQIAVCARTAADMAYACLLGQPWTLLGHSSQPQGLAWVEGRFLCARVHWGEGRLYEQTLDGAVLNSRPCDTSQGILYHDEYLGWVIASNSRETLVGRYRLIKAVRRGAWYCGQATNPDRLVIVRADGSVAFKAGPQPETPLFVVIGDRLVCNGPTEFRPPYPTTDVSPAPPPVPVPVPPVIPKPEPTPVALQAKRLAQWQQDVVDQLYAKHTDLAEGTDDQRRALTKMIVETWRKRGGPRFGWKSNHGIGIAPSKDGGAEIPEGDTFTPNKRQRLYMWDLFNGTTRKPHRLPTSETEHVEQYFVPVEPIDHLADQPVPNPGTPVPNPSTPTVPQPPTIPLPPVPPVCEFAPCDHSEVNKRLAKIENALIALLAESRKPRPVTLSARYLGTITGEIGAPKA